MADYAYIGSYEGDCFEIVNVTDRANPVHVGRLDNGVGGAGLVEPRCVRIQGNYAYVASYISNCMEIISISDPANPSHAAKISHGGDILLNGPYHLFIDNNYAYVVSVLSNSLEIIDISSPTSPAHMGSIIHGTGGAQISNPTSICVVGNYAYITSYATNYLEIVDITNKTSPEHKGNIVHEEGGAVLDGVRDVVVVGNYAYVVSYGSNALEIVDITDPANPLHKGKISHGDGGALIASPTGICVKNNFAYVASYGSSALEIIDISDPANPVHAGKIINEEGGAALYQPISVIVDSTYAYVASYGSDALEIVNISDQTSPIHAGSILDGAGGAGLNGAWGIHLSGIIENKLEFEDTDGNKIMVSLPVFPYKTSIEFPFDIQKLNDGSYSSYDHGSTYDIRKCECTFILDEGETLTFLEFFTNEYEYGVNKGRAFDVTMRPTVSNSGFFPFGPDKGNNGDFDVGVIIKNISRIGNAPYLYFHIDVLIINTGSWPTYSLPSEVSEGSLTIGNVSNNRFPPNWFNPSGGYGYFGTVLQDGSIEWIDRFEGADHYQTSFNMVSNESKTAKVIEYITGTARDDNFSIVSGNNIFPFGKNIPDNKTYTVKMIQNKIDITHVRHDRFEYSLKLAYISYTG